MRDVDTLPPAERERQQLELLDRFFALSPSKRLRQRNLARELAGLPTVEAQASISCRKKTARAA